MSELDLGVVVLCPDRNVGGLINTLGSVRHNCYDRDVLCTVGSDVHPDELVEMGEICPVIKGRTTLTSLINVGVRALEHEWALLIFAGSRVPTHIEKKIATFVTSESDLLFPVVDHKCDFVEGSFNGVVINTGFFARVGDFPEVSLYKEGMNDFEIAKMLWSLDALRHGCIFKAIVGLRII